MARATGFEPATSTVTGWHSNQLSYAPAISCMKLNIHPGLEKSKLKREKSTKKLCSVRKLTAGREWGRIGKETRKPSMKMAERGGFEPPNGKNPLTVFETAAFDRSAISPVYGTPLKICFRRLFASEQSPTGKIFGGYLQVATLKSSCIGVFAHPLKIHPIEFLELPCIKSRE